MNGLTPLEVLVAASKQYADAVKELEGKIRELAYFEENVAKSRLETVPAHKAAVAEKLAALRNAQAAVVAVEQQ